jgi:hypothetical protein
MTITITEESPDSADALALIGELDAILMPMYDAKDRQDSPVSLCYEKRLTA